MIKKSKTNIHVSPKKIIDMAIQFYGIQEKCSIERELFVANKHCIGYIIRDTGDIFINLKYISDNHKENFLSRVISNISHEVMHNVLQLNENKLISRKWDNIAEDIRTDGFLGGV
jgi:hypothetical protein